MMRFDPPPSEELSPKALKDIERAERVAEGMGPGPWSSESMIIKGLLPCPFCGYPAPVLRMRYNTDLDRPRIFKSIRCGWCGCGTQDSATDLIYHAETWNRRAEPWPI